MDKGYRPLPDDLALEDRASPDGDLPEIDEPTPTRPQDTRPNFFSWLTFSWIWPTLKYGFKHELELDDLPTLDPSDSTASTYANLHKHYLWYSGTRPGTSQRRARHPLLWALLRTFIPILLVTALLKLVFDLLNLSLPLLIRSLLNSLTQPEFSLLKTSLYAASIPALMLCASLALVRYFFTLFRIGLRLRSSLTSLLYAKALRLNLFRCSQGSGELSNTITSDVKQLENLIFVLHLWWSCLVQLVYILIQLSFILGAVTWAGVGVLFLSLPVDAKILSLLSRTRVELLKVSDERIKVITETLNSIRTIKSFGYELLFEQAVETKRAVELHLLRRYIILKAVSFSLHFVAPSLAAAAVFVLYTGLGNTLTPSIAFSALVLFNFLSFPLGFLPRSLTSYVEAWVSIRRIQILLDLPEIDAPPGRLVRETFDESVTGPGPVIGTSCEARVASVGEGVVVLRQPSPNPPLPPQTFGDPVHTLTSAELKTLPQTLIAIQIVSGTFSWCRDSDHVRVPRGEGRSEGDTVVDSLSATDPHHSFGDSRSGDNLSPSLGTRLEAEDLAQGSGDGVVGIGTASCGGEPLGGGAVFGESVVSSREAGGVSRSTPLGQPPRSRDAGVTRVSDSTTTLPRSRVTLHEVTLNIPRGKLVGVVGPVGSGKSSLLLGILGELVQRSGTLKVNGRVAYAPQHPWMKNGTLRKNILFGESWDPVRYREAIYISGLGLDLEQIPGRDLAEIGENGIALSGGQKARVSLARCLYSGRDIYLLDDPLSALDAHVGTHVFFKSFCSQGGYLHDRTRLLVLNYLHLLVHVDYVIYIHSGEVCQYGSYTELLSETQPSQLRLSSCDTLVPSFRQFVILSNGPGSVLRVGSSTSLLVSAPPSPSVVSSVHSDGRLLNERDYALARELVVGSEEGRCESRGSEGSGRLILSETRARGAIQWSVIHGYLKGFGGKRAFLGVVFVFLLYQLIQLLTNLWLASYTSPDLLQRVGLPEDLSNASFLRFMSGYFSFIFFEFILSWIRLIVLTLLCLRASRVLFEGILERLLRAKISWFDQTPLGRIVNRCSSDTNTTDLLLPENLSNLAHVFFLLFGVYVLLLISSPPFLIPVVLALVFYYWLQKIYRRSSIQFQRLESVAKSPMYALVGETFIGLVTVRSFGVAPTYFDQIVQYVDRTCRARWALLVANRWLSLRLDLISIVVVSVVTGVAVTGRNGFFPPALAGLALSQVLTMTSSYTWAVQTLVETETNLNSVERILEYSEETPENVLSASLHRSSGTDRVGDSAPNTSSSTLSLDSVGGSRADVETDGVPDRGRCCSLLCGRGRAGSALGVVPLEPPLVIPEVDTPLVTSGWPQRGAIRFEQLEFRYRPELVPSLRSVTLEINAGQKVGIVGRTGSGKSTLLKALLRVAEPTSGRILIDGVDVTSVGLSTLRQAITYVPQTPVLFRGSIRTNLDWRTRGGVVLGGSRLRESGGSEAVGGSSGAEASDGRLWSALGAVRITGVVRAMPQGLDTILSGHELSVGEQQLLCFARSLLHGGRIVCLDEATASIDIHSESLIQQAIRREFREKTIVLIAHRLDTIIDSDIVVVIGGGAILEQGPPWALLQDPVSAFSRLVSETGERADAYREAARLAHEAGGFGMLGYHALGSTDSTGPL